MTVPRRSDLTSYVAGAVPPPRRARLPGRRSLLGAALLLGALVAPGVSTALAQEGAAGFALIPYPAQLEPGAGEWRPGSRLVKER